MSTPLKVLIVEDEVITAASLSEYIESAGYEVCGICPRAKAAWDMIQSTQPDLVFLDINLKGEETGIWLAEKIRKERNTPFVFLTSYSDKDTISKALTTTPNGYLIKPFNEAQIYSSISVALNNFAGTPVENPASQENQDTVAIHDNFFIKDKDAYTKVKVSSVLYLEADNNYVTIYAENRRFVIRNSMKDLLEQISSPNLISISRSYCVNVHKIDKIGPQFVQIGDNQLPMSRSMKDGVMEKFRFLTGR